MKKMSFVRGAMLLSAIVMLISIYSCTDIPDVRQDQFVPAGAGDGAEPDIRILVDEKPSFTISIQGGFKILAEDESTYLYRNRDGLPPVDIRSKDGQLILGILGTQRPARFDIILSSSRGFVNVNKTSFYNSVRVLARGDRVMIINILPIERYLYGVVTAELGANQPLEALKAQAVAARTYALYDYKSRRSQPYHLRRTALSQVFKPSDTYSRDVMRAVEQTRGQVLTHGGKMIKAYFSSTCGGKTANIDDVWDCLPQTTFTSVPCESCRGSKFYSWGTEFTRGEIRRALLDNHVQKFRVGTVHSIEVPSKGRGRSERVRFVKIKVDANSHDGMIVLTGMKLRQILGADKIKSTWFNVVATNNGFVFSGNGYGHGVGMCQVGAIRMGKEGLTYLQILDRYYLDTRIFKLY